MVADDSGSQLRLSKTQLGIVYVSGSFGFGFQQMAAFLLPLRAWELNAPLDHIGLFLSAGALFPALFSVWAGQVADRLGARRTYIWSTVVAGICALLMFPVTNYWLLLPTQLVMGFARTTAWLASQTYVANMGTKEESAVHMGRLSFSTNAGTIVAPLAIGQAANIWDYQSSFLVMAATTFAYALLGFFIPDVRAPRTPTTSTNSADATAGFRAAWGLMQQRGMQIAMLLSFVRLFSYVGWRPFITIFLRENGYDNTVIATVLAANALVSTLTTLCADWLARRTSNEVATAISLGLGSLGTAISPFILDLPALYIPSILVGIGAGISLPLLMASVRSEVPPDQRGVALGVRMSTNQTASAAAPVALGAVAEPFGIPAAMVVCGLISFGVLGTSMGLYASDRRQSRAGT